MFFKSLALESIFTFYLIFTRSSYDFDLSDKIQAECEAAFASGFSMLSKQELHQVPSTLLSDITAKEYCIANIVSIHGMSLFQYVKVSKCIILLILQKKV